MGYLDALSPLNTPILKDQLLAILPKRGILLLCKGKETCPLPHLTLRNLPSLQYQPPFNDSQYRFQKTGNSVIHELLTGAIFSFWDQFQLQGNKGQANKLPKRTDLRLNRKRDQP